MFPHTAKSVKNTVQSVHFRDKGTSGSRTRYISVMRLLLITVLLALRVFAELPPVKGTITQDLSKSLGFCYGQKFSLERIGRLYPEFSQSIKLAEAEWNISFKGAETNLERRLEGIVQGQWP